MVDEEGMTALLHAANRGYTDTVKVLLESRADVNHIAGYDMYGQPTHQMIEFYDKPLSEFFGTTALHIMADWWTPSNEIRSQIIKMLLAFGADVRITESRLQGTSALDWALPQFIDFIRPEQSQMRYVEKIILILHCKKSRRMPQKQVLVRRNASKTHFSVSKRA